MVVELWKPCTHGHRSVRLPHSYDWQDNKGFLVVLAKAIDLPSCMVSYRNDISKLIIMHMKLSCRVRGPRLLTVSKVRTLLGVGEVYGSQTRRIIYVLAPRIWRGDAGTACSTL